MNIFNATTENRRILKTNPSAQTNVLYVMKKRLVLFLLAQDQEIYEVQRGPYRGFPCKLLNVGESAAQAAYETLDRGKFYLHGIFPSPVLIAERYDGATGEQVDFEYDGQPVTVEYYVLTNYVRFIHSVHNLSFLLPDIFVSFFRNSSAAKKFHAA